MNYEARVWHRGWGDWAWELRSVDEGGATDIVSRGYRSNREKARCEAAEEAANRRLRDAAKWESIV